MSTPARITFEGVTKSFGATRALRGVSFSARAGEVHAILGENGAGKSTLMNILAGAFAPDAGTITLDGASHAPAGPLAARDAGIAMVHQELSLCPHLTVAENILLGMEPRRFGLIDRKAMKRRAEKALALVVPEAADEASLPGIRADAIVGDLPSSARQLVEIARALAHSGDDASSERAGVPVAAKPRNEASPYRAGALSPRGPACRVLVLDEPTSSLTARDTERLFEVIRKLAAGGLTVLYISHFLEEVLAIADRYTVLRDGETVASGEVAGTTIDALVEKMAGRKGSDVFPPRTHAPSQEVALVLDGVAGVERPREASLTLHRGEILGVFGLVGSGRTELLRAVFGLDPVKSGTVRVGAYAGPASPAKRLDQGVGLLSEDRAGEGVALSLSVADNLAMSAHGKLLRYGLFSPSALHTEAARWIERLAIKCAGPDAPVSSLSGGNQQKVALGRLLFRDVDVLLLDEPTRGIDVTSKAQIYRLLFELASSGKAILMVSSYLPELHGVCDRIAVMSRGVLGAGRPASERTEEDLLREATGA
jgi:ribose transport system ATP-binding protein